MKIALAQTQAIKGNIPQNLALSQSCVEVAAALGGDIILFPELSLTAYEPKLAKELACQALDTRLDVLQALSKRYEMIIGVGLPLRSKKGIHIGQVFFQPHAPRMTYTKQYLHADELPYFVPGEEQLIVNYQGLKLAPAICYESLRPEHAEQAQALGAQLYLASVAKPQKGIDQAYAYYPILAQKYQMPVVMVNAIGYCDNFVSAGGSAVWDEHGTLKGNLSPDKPGLLVWDTESKKLEQSLP